jgi:hypothetical protein
VSINLNASSYQHLVITQISLNCLYGYGIHTAKAIRYFSFMDDDIRYCFTVGDCYLSLHTQLPDEYDDVIAEIPDKMHRLAFRAIIDPAYQLTAYLERWT